MTIVALLSVVSVTVAVTLATAGSSADREDLIRSSGAQALTSVELTDLVKRKGLTAFWLGPISGSKYTLVATDTERVTITYLAGGLGIDNATQRNLVIVTVINGAKIGGLLAYESEVNHVQDLIVTGNTFSYDSLLLDHMKVKIHDSGRHVLVLYPQNRSALSMQTDAEALEKIG